MLIMSVFHGVPGVCKNGTLCGCAHKLALGLNAVGEGLWGEVTICLCRTHVN